MSVRTRIRSMLDWPKPEQRRARRLRKLKSKLDTLEKEWNHLRTTLTPRGPSSGHWYELKRAFRTLEARRLELRRQILTIES